MCFTFRLVVEFPPTGGALSSVQFSTVKLIRYVNSLDYFVMACEAIFVLFILYYIIEETIEVCWLINWYSENNFCLVISMETKTDMEYNNAVGWSKMAMQFLSIIYSESSLSHTIAIAETHYQPYDFSHILCLVSVNVQQVSMTISRYNYFSVHLQFITTLSCHSAAIYNKAKEIWAVGRKAQLLLSNH